ncbi:hypothetical protein [Hansschlegelia plantiphila]|uniref:Pyrrolidone-carboxylate peptidase n=1 Tax=Hansschlegelia plantiphila TaxID=374655 RepID=A0A9W6MW07_9HYPH|nr:hypothetical protein [Hansschlegelia plantiphila]GLK68352.1 hypothetical protein GCM10008179_19900 [Hansschlegelia plantiphila]
MSLLLTAFGRFDGGPNCSERLLEALAADRAALEAIWRGPVAAVRLDVDSETVAAALRSAVERARPTHVLLMGQASGRDALCFERIARNRRDLRTPDIAGRIGDLGPVAPGGPDQLEATWPDLAALAAALVAEGVPARVSDDAGAHLCNQTLYTALRAAERASPRFVVAFVHLPLLPEQVAAQIPAAASRPGCPTVALDDMARAVRAVLRHTRRDEA